MLGNLIRRLCGALQRNIILVGLFYALILGAILYPITPHRTKSRATTCFSNVKQAALGLWMYSHDYDDHFPRATECMDSTYPYVKDKSVYRCPQNHSTRPTDFGYAFNASLSLKSLDNYKTPEKVVMLYDANDLRWNANAPGRTGVANPSRHQGADFFGFADGHAQSQSPVVQNE